MKEPRHDKPCCCTHGSKNNFNDTLKQNSYFQSLPVFIQETIEQSGTVIQSEDQLRDIAQSLLDNDRPSNKYYD